MVLSYRTAGGEWAMGMMKVEMCALKDEIPPACTVRLMRSVSLYDVCWIKS